MSTWPGGGTRVDTPRWFARTALGLFVLLASSACLISIGGCSSEEASYFSEVEHYGGVELEPEDDGLGRCGASFDTTDDPEVVIEHYRSRLEDAGWTIDPPPPPPPAGPGDVAQMATVTLSARKGTVGYSVSAELFGRSETNFVIHVGDMD